MPTWWWLPSCKRHHNELQEMLQLTKTANETTSGFCLNNNKKYIWLKQLVERDVWSITTAPSPPTPSICPHSSISFPIWKPSRVSTATGVKSTVSITLHSRKWPLSTHPTQPIHPPCSSHIGLLFGPQPGPAYIVSVLLTCSSICLNMAVSHYSGYSLNVTSSESLPWPPQLM